MCILRLENIKPKPLPNGNLTLYKLKSSVMFFNVVVPLFTLLLCFA
jgi:hypothetical protein